MTKEDKILALGNDYMDYLEELTEEQVDIIVESSYFTLREAKQEIKDEEEA